jgi:hypothetical protein
VQEYGGLVATCDGATEGMMRNVASCITWSELCQGVSPLGVPPGQREIFDGGGDDMAATIRTRTLTGLTAGRRRWSLETEKGLQALGLATQKSSGQMMKGCGGGRSDTQAIGRPAGVGAGAGSGGGAIAEDESGPPQGSEGEGAEGWMKIRCTPPSRVSCTTAGPYTPPNPDRKCTSAMVGGRVDLMAGWISGQ